eukprot:GHVT01009675.1.p1 GENE.GHVT01009675.1~~GHVT01009675.1.p1  ORF type:complete len:472 (+),score=7.65 GHVT01009675.1:434-1849(+)
MKPPPRFRGLYIVFCILVTASLVLVWFNNKHNHFWSPDGVENAYVPGLSKVLAPKESKNNEGASEIGKISGDSSTPDGYPTKVSDQKENVESPLQSPIPESSAGTAKNRIPVGPGILPTCGLRLMVTMAIRDHGQRRIPRIAHNLRRLAPYWETISVIVVENDSVDNTKDMLKLWKKFALRTHDNPVTPIEADGREETGQTPSVPKNIPYKSATISPCPAFQAVAGPHSFPDIPVSSKRFSGRPDFAPSWDFIGPLRSFAQFDNYYTRGTKRPQWPRHADEFIISAETWGKSNIKYNHSDMCPDWDAEEVMATINTLLQHRDKWDVLTAYGYSSDDGRYQDIFAYRDKNIDYRPIEDDDFDAHIRNTPVYNMFSKRAVFSRSSCHFPHSLYTSATCEMVADQPLITVNSAFGGWALYKAAALKDTECTYFSEIEMDCEHVGLHRCLVDAGYKIRMAPNIVIRWTGQPMESC